MKSIYLDVCSLQRPSDDCTQPRIAAEAQAVGQLIEQIESGSIALLASEVIEIELAQMRDPRRLAVTRTILNLAARRVVVSAEVQAKWREFEAGGIKSMDALHIASAAVGRRTSSAPAMIDSSTASGRLSSIRLASSRC